MYNFNFKKISQKKFILLGETHGVRENVEIIKTFITSLEAKNKSIIIALEWPKKINSDIQIFLNSNSETKVPWQNWDFAQDQDGRISKEHIELLEWIKIKNNNLLADKKNDIFCFSEDHKSWNLRDRKMAQNIKLLLEENKQKIVLAIMGSLHAQKKELMFDGRIHNPLATYLPPKDTVTFKCNYLGGEFFNHTLQSFDKLKKDNHKRITIELSPKEEFDYYITVPQAQPITLLAVLAK